MAVTDLLYRVAGRLSLFLEFLRPVLAAARGDQRRARGGTHFDKTGMLVGRAVPLEVLWDDEDVLYVRQGSFAHSFWRAQEFSLIRRYKNLLEKPILDFGCGDGSFASALFSHVDYGVDNDLEPLAVAKQYGLYDTLLVSSEVSIPLPAESVRSIVSNSVLEHLMDLESMIADFSRILVGGGRLMFTVPVPQFTEQLTKYFGHRESLRINEESCHRNLLNPDAWRNLLVRHGFCVDFMRHYQPDRFTYWYRMFRLLGPRGLGFFFPGITDMVWGRWGRILVEMVRSSIMESESGGNILVICSKR